MPSLMRLNAMDPERLSAELMRVCGSQNWAKLMIHSRPFKNETALFESAAEIWKSLKKTDWLEAFACHPRIGTSNLEVNGEHGTWAKNEQAGVTSADAKTLSGLKKLNDDYFKKFGYIFLVCATGKSAVEMLGLLEQRIKNDVGAEIEIAAGEQNKITKLRLEKLLKS